MKTWKRWFSVLGSFYNGKSQSIKLDNYFLQRCKFSDLQQCINPRHHFVPDWCHARCKAHQNLHWSYCQNGITPLQPSFPLPTPFFAEPGRYWLSVQAVMPGNNTGYRWQWNQRNSGNIGVVGSVAVTKGISFYWLDSYSLWIASEGFYGFFADVWHPVNAIPFIPAFDLTFRISGNMSEIDLTEITSPYSSSSSESGMSIKKSSYQHRIQ